MMGRSGHDKNWCLNFRHSKAQWIKYHLPNDFNGVWFQEFPLWITEDTESTFIQRDLEIDGHTAHGKSEKQAAWKLKSIGAKEPCVWAYILVTRNALPILHLLLGLGNKAMNHFWEFIQDWIEKLDDEVTQHQNISTTSCIALDKVASGWNIACSELESIAKER